MFFPTTFLLKHKLYKIFILAFWLQFEHTYKWIKKVLKRIISFEHKCFTLPNLISEHNLICFSFFLCFSIKRNKKNKLKLKHVSFAPPSFTDCTCNFLFQFVRVKAQLNKKCYFF